MAAMITAARDPGNADVPLIGTSSPRPIGDDRGMRHPGGEGGPSVADRVFVVIEACAASGRALTLADLVQRTGMPKTTLHRVCWKLVEHGMLEHDTEGFRVGTKMFALGSTNPGLRRLRSVSMPFLQTLVARSGWVVNLAILSDRRALIVEEVFSDGMPSVLRMGGATMPLHATAIGKALLCGLDPDALDDLVGTAALRPYTRRTIVRPNLLREHLAGIRRTGLAFSHEEWRMGTSGVAAPVIGDGRVVAAVALVGVPDEKTLHRLSPAVRAAATGLGRALAATPEPAGVVDSAA
jgi:DNA-binding IclR family transcriptional regulator